MNVVHFPSCTTAQRAGGVINSLYGSEPAQHSCQVGRRNTLCPWEISRQELSKPCLSSAEFPVHTLKFCTLLKVSPENLTSAAIGECQNWAQRGGESLKAKWELPSRRKAPFPLQQKSPVPQRCPAATQAGSGDLQGSGLCLVECGEQLVHSKITSKQTYRVIEQKGQKLEAKDQCLTGAISCPCLHTNNQQ